MDSDHRTWSLHRAHGTTVANPPNEGLFGPHLMSGRGQEPAGPDRITARDGNTGVLRPANAASPSCASADPKACCPYSASAWKAASTGMSASCRTLALMISRAVPLRESSRSASRARGGQHLVVRDDAVDEPDPVGVVRPHLVTQQHQLHGEGVRDLADQPGEGPSRRDDADARLGQGEARALAADPQVRRQHHLESSAEAQAVHRGDDRLVERAVLLVGPVPVRDVEPALRERRDRLVQVRSDTEGPVPGAGDHDDADLLVVPGPVERAPELVVHAQGQGVQLVRSVDRDQRDPVVHGVGDPAHQVAPPDRRPSSWSSSRPQRRRSTSSVWAPNPGASPRGVAGVSLSLSGDPTMRRGPNPG